MHNDRASTRIQVFLLFLPSNGHNGGNPDSKDEKCRRYACLSHTIHRHASLTNKADDDFRVFQYKMYITDELIRLLRGYGKQVEVLSPEILQHEILH